MANEVKLTGFANYIEEVNGGGHRFTLSVGVKNPATGEYDKNGSMRCYAAANVDLSVLDEGKPTTVTGFMGFSFRDKVDANGEPEMTESGKPKYTSYPQVVVMSVEQD